MGVGRAPPAGEPAKNPVPTPHFPSHRLIRSLYEGGGDLDETGWEVSGVERGSFEGGARSDSRGFTYSRSSLSLAPLNVHSLPLHPTALLQLYVESRMKIPESCGAVRSGDVSGLERSERESAQ